MRKEKQSFLIYKQSVIFPQQSALLQTLDEHCFTCSMQDTLEEKAFRVKTDVCH